MDKTLLTLGHGYVAAALARRLLPEGWTVIGTTRSADKVARIAATGVTPVVWDGGPLAALDEASHILISAAPGERGDPILDALRDEIAARADRTRWVGYLSVTSVYGDHDGDWVDEDTPTAPGSARAQARVTAEAAWQSIPSLPVHVFRLPGIYGPGRSAIERVQSGTARRIVKPGQVFSRIHVDDIAQTLHASIIAPNPGRIYNVCDDEPCGADEVLAHAADLLGVPRPPEVPFEEADLGPMARSFYADSKRVRNDRIKSDLGVELLYPTYREGLAAILKQVRG